MKNKYLIVAAAVLLSFIIVALPFVSSTKAVKPPTGYDGITGQYCNHCHSNTLNSGGGNITVTFSGYANQYKPDSVYDITVTDFDPSTSLTRFGFESSIVTATSHAQSGFFTILNAVNTSLQTVITGNLQYIGHLNANSNNTWMFTWTAPSSSQGNLTIYTASCCTNNNNSSSGDHVYSNQTSLQPVVSGGVSMASTENEFLNVAGVASSTLLLQYHLNAAGNIQATIIDMNGSEVLSLLRGATGTGTFNQAFNIAALNAGMYVIALNVDGRMLAQKFVKQ